MNEQKEILHLPQNIPRTMVGLVLDAQHIRSVLRWLKEESPDCIFLFGSISAVSSVMSTLSIREAIRPALTAIKVITTIGGQPIYCFILGQPERITDKRFVYPPAFGIFNSIVDIIKKRTKPGERIQIVGDVGMTFRSGVEDKESTAFRLQEELLKQHRVGVI